MKRRKPRMNKLHLIEYFPNYLSTDSLFTKMSQLGAPWPQEVGQDMDDAYFTMYSGVKNPSDFVLLHLNPESDIANSLTLARILYGIYGENWTKLWEAFKVDYNPIDNLNIKETVTRNQTNDRTINKNISNSGTQDDTTTTTYGENIDSTDNTKSYTYGFNSTEKVPTGESDSTGTEAHSGEDSVVDKQVTESTTTDNTTDNDEENENTERVRQGNSGQNTYQDLLRQEFDLWRWNFFTSVFEDVDKFLVLSVYSSCTNKHSSVN